MDDRQVRRRGKRQGRVKTHTEDGIKKNKPGEIADMLFMDMVAHRKKTAEFNQGWKRALFYASVGLAFVSMLKAAQKVREGNFGWMERSLTAANAGLIAAWVAQVDGLGQQTYLLVSQIAAFALSLYQLLSWWTSRQKEEHVDFPVAVILFVVVLAALASMKSTLSTADKAFQASGALADKVSAKR